jgi:hypothetical protein
MLVLEAEEEVVLLQLEQILYQELVEQVQEIVLTQVQQLEPLDQVQV